MKSLIHISEIEGSQSKSIDKSMNPHLLNEIRTFQENKFREFTLADGNSILCYILSNAEIPENYTEDQLSSCIKWGYGQVWFQKGWNTWCCKNEISSIAEFRQAIKKRDSRVWIASGISDSFDSNDDW